MQKIIEIIHSILMCVFCVEILRIEFSVKKAVPVLGQIYFSGQVQRKFIDAI